MPGIKLPWTRMACLLVKYNGEMAEWFKAAVLTRRQDAEANIDASRWPRRGGGQDARNQTAVGAHGVPVSEVQRRDGRVV